MNLLFKFLLLVNTWEILTKHNGICLRRTYRTSPAHRTTVGAAPYFRVISGKTPSIIDEFIYQAAMLEKLTSTRFRIFCGGTVIAPNKVLSAAHCFYTKNIKSPCGFHIEKASYIIPLAKLYVVAGSDLMPYEILKVNKTFLPRNFDFPRSDITVVFTTGDFYSAKPLPYAREHKTYGGLSCIASGYGRARVMTFKTIRYVKLKIISTSKCSKLHSRNMKRFVCTLGHPQDLEEGDAGGPLVCKNTGHRNEGPRGIIVGIISGKRIFRNGTGENATLESCVFYTRVSSFRQFIEKPSNRAQMIVADLTIWISAFSFAAETSLLEPFGYVNLKIIPNAAIVRRTKVTGNGMDLYVKIGRQKLR